MKILNASILLLIVLLGFTLSAQITINKQFFNPAPKNNTNTIDEVEVCRDGIMGLAYKMRMNNETKGVEKQLLLIRIDSAVISFVDILKNKVVKLYKVSDLEEVREETTMIPHLRKDKCFELEFNNEDEKKEMLNICVQKSGDCKITKYLFTKAQFIKVFKILKNCNSILQNYFRKLKEREEYLKRMRKKKLSQEELARLELEKALEAARLEAERKRKRQRSNRNRNSLTDSEDDMINDLLGDYRGKRKKGKKVKGTGFNQTLQNELHNITLQVNKYAELQYNKTENMALYQGFQIPSDLLDYFKKAFDCISKNTDSFVNPYHYSLNGHTKNKKDSSNKNIDLKSISHSFLLTKHSADNEDFHDHHDEKSEGCKKNNKKGINKKYKLNIQNYNKESHKRHLRHHKKKHTH